MTEVLAILDDDPDRTAAMMVAGTGGRMTTDGNASFFCSWSGGKDSALALYHARSEGRRAEALPTMTVPGGWSWRRARESIGTATGFRT